MSTRLKEPPKQPRLLFGHGRSLHAVLGGGKMADIMLWEEKQKSAAILGAASFIWFLFEVMEYHFVTFLCHSFIAIMLVLFIWHNAPGIVTWIPPKAKDLEITEYTCRHFFRRLNWFLETFYNISIGKDLTLFFATICGLWIMSAIGSYFTALNLIYFLLICMMTLPLMYERYEYEVNYLASKGNDDLRRLLNAVDSKFFNKIPRGPVKEKKYK